MKKILIFLTILLFSFNCTNNQNQQKILSQTLNKLKDIDCIMYKESQGASAPADTVIISHYNAFFKLKMNNNDTMVGSDFLIFLDDTNKIYINYHNYINKHYNWNNKTVRIDTLNPKRPSLMTPFYPEVKGLLEYTIKNRDSVKVDVYKENSLYKVLFEFTNKNVYLTTVPNISRSEKTTKFYLWITPEFMPVKLKTYGTYQTSFTEILWSKNINCEQILKMQKGLYLPDGFSIYDKTKKRKTAINLEGSKAKPWNLKDTNNEIFKLSDYQNKNLLLEFTSIGCGHCQEAIPFLNKFHKEYENKNFNVISIISANETEKGIKRYEKINPVNYKLLVADKTIFSDYNIYGVPVFILINTDGIIEKVFIGYSKDTSDKKIMKYATQMLNK